MEPLIVFFVTFVLFMAVWFIALLIGRAIQKKKLAKFKLYLQENVPGYDMETDRVLIAKQKAYIVYILDLSMRRSIVSASISILKRNPKLIIFPLISGILSIILLVAIVLPLYGTINISQIIESFIVVRFY